MNRPDVVDVVIVGGGPGGLSAALTLGRARRTVVMFDAGPRRNAAAESMHNFPTRDGTSPREFRRIAREQLATYPNVSVRDELVHEIFGERGAFDVTTDCGQVRARRILLCTGMIDELPHIPGFREHWGRSIVICPYCHGWEAQDQRFGYLATNADTATFAIFLRGWSEHVVLFTCGTFAVPDDLRARLSVAGVRVEERPITRITSENGAMAGVELAHGSVEPLDVLFAHPPQQHVALVQSLGPTLTSAGHLAVNAMTSETSLPGVFAAGDLIVAAQSALGAASSSMYAAAMINHELVMELAASGALA